MSKTGDEAMDDIDKMSEVLQSFCDRLDLIAADVERMISQKEGMRELLIEGHRLLKDTYDPALVEYRKRIGMVIANT